MNLFRRLAPSGLGGLAFRDRVRRRDRRRANARDSKQNIEEFSCYPMLEFLLASVVAEFEEKLREAVAPPPPPEKLSEEKKEETAEAVDADTMEVEELPLEQLLSPEAMASLTEAKAAVDQDHADMSEMERNVIKRELEKEERLAALAKQTEDDANKANTGVDKEQAEEKKKEKVPN
eukprot:TRINITY_DN1495_c0_g1_i2.p1 TRINITY_DN1495_c0_g1~~TRINITY_DN1495_c0_g1_i2.p1  ORF type:complete len:177 (+),score=59.35 TRINITY_DN1495_c0_g1_i2:797-1327(+)